MLADRLRPHIGRGAAQSSILGQRRGPIPGPGPYGMVGLGIRGRLGPVVGADRCLAPHGAPWADRYRAGSCPGSADRGHTGPLADHGTVRLLWGSRVASGPLLYRIGEVSGPGR